MVQYRWSSPNEWLLDKLDRMADDDEMNAIHRIARDLVRLVDADELQDLFQSEMDDDGYFETSDTRECEQCGERLTLQQMADPEIHDSIGRELLCLDCHRSWLDIDHMSCRGCDPQGEQR